MAGKTAAKSAKSVIGAKEIQKLREETGAGVMECKQVLVEADGDFERAKELIHERGFAKVEKRADRATGAGLVKSYVHNERIGVLLELRAETDFVVRSDPFQELARELAMQIASMDPQNLEELLAQPYIRDEKLTVKDMVTDVIRKVGENVTIGRFFRIEV
jgi:elongation factor Ts